MTSAFRLVVDLNNTTIRAELCLQDLLLLGIAKELTIYMQMFSSFYRLSVQLKHLSVVQNSVLSMFSLLVLDDAKATQHA